MRTEEMKVNKFVSDNSLTMVELGYSITHKKHYFGYNAQGNEVSFTYDEKNESFSKGYGWDYKA